MVGSAVLRELVSQGVDEVVLLVRASDESELHSRVDRLLEFCEVDRESIATRVSALIGDTSVTRFGLSDDAYDRLCSACTHVIHSAGAVRMNLELEDARKSAVGSAKALLRFLTDCRQASGSPPKTEFISTVGVGGRMAGEVPERWIGGPREFHNTYEQSKAEAEALLESAGCKEWRITVHRPSMVVGDSRTGKSVHFQVFYHLVEFVTGRRTFGFHPHFGKAQLDIVPCDFVAKAIVWSCMNDSTEGKILHLCSGQKGAIGLEQLQRIARERFLSKGQRIPHLLPVPVRLLRTVLPVLGFLLAKKSRKALSTLPVFLDYLESDQHFANTVTVPLLAEAGLTLPSTDEYLGRVLDAYLVAKYPQS